ncbi:hypothetical protein DPMN_102577, partial [Dreissena polymorpha]
SFIGMITEKAGEPLECEYGITFCGQNKECVLPAGSKSRHGVCTCKNGFTKDMSGKCVEVANKGHNSESPLECEYGVTVCGLSKVCVLPVGSKARNGVCMCEKGFEEDSSGKCVDKGDNSKMPVTTDTGGSGLNKNLTEKTATSDGSLGDREFISTTTVKASTGQGTTTMIPIPEIKKNTTPSVTLLTVSIGPNKVIQLPDNQVTLKAFTLPEEDKDNPYHYDWTLEAHPGGENTGNMAGKNTNTLVLTQFGDARVNYGHGIDDNDSENTGHGIDDSENTRHGIDDNDSENTGHGIDDSENTGHGIDDSENTGHGIDDNDMKILNYQWEMVQGPLQDKTIAGEAAILTLTDLVPGNYTFNECTMSVLHIQVSVLHIQCHKFTCCNFQCIVNQLVTCSTQTHYGTLTCCTFKSANAGSDIVINLPQNSVVLNGNLSTDDKGIVSSDKLAADMQAEFIAGDQNVRAPPQQSRVSRLNSLQGTRTSELHLSNLEVGDFMFSLKAKFIAGDQNVRAPPQQSRGDQNVRAPPQQSRGDQNVGDYMFSLKAKLIAGDQNLRAPPQQSREVGDYMFCLKAKFIAGNQNDRAPPQQSTGDQNVRAPPQQSRGDQNIRAPPQQSRGDQNVRATPQQSRVSCFSEQNKPPVAMIMGTMETSLPQEASC